MSGTDCLVLLIEDSIIYMNLFILFDNERDSFFICGQKIADANFEWVPYSFYCKEERILMRFICNIMDETVNIRLYNFNSIPLSCTDITFDILKNAKSESCEIMNCMEQERDFINIEDYLVILKNVHNNFSM
jgi:hypothetical protein